MSDNENIDALRQSNNERMLKLYEAGMTLEPVAILKARVDLISDVLFKSLGLDDDVIEEQWELLIADMLDQVDQVLSEQESENESPE